MRTSFSTVIHSGGMGAEIQYFILLFCFAFCVCIMSSVHSHWLAPQAVSAGDASLPVSSLFIVERTKALSASVGDYGGTTLFKMPRLFSSVSPRNSSCHLSSAACRGAFPQRVAAFRLGPETANQSRAGRLSPFFPWS